MDSDWLTTFLQHYNWLGALLSLTCIVAISKTGKWLVFKVPALEKMREINRAEDKEKWQKEKYPPIVRASQKVGLYCNVTFFTLILPFCVTLTDQPLWKFCWIYS